MQKLLSSCASLALIILVSACGAGSRSGQTADDSVERARREVERSTEEMQRTTSENIRKTFESAMDITAAGGQPGAIFLSGGMVTDNLILDRRFSITRLGGKSWKGIRAKLIENDFPPFTKTIPSDALKDWALLENDRTFVNLGCDPKTMQEFVGLKEQIQADLTNPVILSANTIAICGSFPNTTNLAVIAAKNLVFSSGDLSIVGTLAHGLSISAKNLILKNHSRLKSKGMDDSSTLHDGPSISVNSQNIIGDGTIVIYSEGSSYKTP